MEVRDQPLVFFTAILLGLAASNTTVSDGISVLIIPSLVVMLYFVFIEIKFADISKAAKNRSLISASLGLNFVFTPILAFVLGWIFLPDIPDMWIGLIILLVTPCTDWYLAYTKFARGDVPACLTLLPWNLILQLALLPIYLEFFTGALINIEPDMIINAMGLVLGVPILSTVFSRWKLPDNLKRKLISKSSSLQTWALALAIFAMFASEGDALLNSPLVFTRFLLPLLLFYPIIFTSGLIIGKILNFEFRRITCLVMTTTARNSPLSLAIVVAAFPDRPQIALALVLAPLIEIPVLVLLSKVLPLWEKYRYIN
ncbi:arsenite efflux pump ACR3-like permease [Candidatus Methanoperedens nitroreducens]|uniref:Arsenite efflux pump ACR3-like permease n=1 Tax=Candidatus Methanoperedens nitratireducens TaxID=1392998 RepID=A0A062V3G3_9EURY|nr:arsenic resistance protein [Candidatus Methanoperedens nitroreducens]KCZ71877.1 arsenite efflux pump ACR3-like permease [Candidatus Methanoperedens nitroreducens]MDJ1422148.1 arsenic resistance protein [Candidatus Methanoperedens sp.]